MNEVNERILDAIQAWDRENELRHAAEEDLADLRERIRGLRDAFTDASISLALEANESAFAKENQAYSAGKSMGFRYASEKLSALLYSPASRED